MRIFFLCRTGHHTSLLAAAMFLGGNPFTVPGFDKIKSKDIGKPFYVGKNHNGTEIYTIGVNGENLILTRAVADMLHIMGIHGNEWRIVDTSQFISRWTIVGLKAKKLWLTPLANVLFQLGVRSELKKLHQLIHNQNTELTTN